MRVGLVILPSARWSEARERWQAAEALGFHHAFTYDHLTWRSFRDASWFGAVPTLAAAALATERIRLGTLVASPNFRHPVPFAKEVMSLDDLASGRLLLGLGAGGSGFDATALGQPAWSPRERAERFAEFVELLDRLLSQPRTSFDGRFYHASEARAIPGCVQQPRVPFLVAAEGPRAMALAARFGAGWVTVDGRGAGATQIERLRDTCEAAGRDWSTVSRFALLGFEERPLASLEAFRDVVGRFGELGFTDLVVHWPDRGFDGEREVLERAAAELDAD
jgi:alkanesulfonate monooxygenase SsuD/methylene tetrahydromethanopterin reductase-like flavin-dependent oxidoreductase (luciferase family)